MSGASISPNSPSCSSRTSRCAARGARSTPGLRRSPIELVWPDAVRVDNGLVGGARLAWPDGPEDEPPAWLVFAGMIRTVSMAESEPGLHPMSAALEEEGFDGLGSGRLVESFARHLMVLVDAWQEKGFAAVAKEYLSRLAPEKDLRRDIDDNGDLLIRRVGKAEAERRRLVPALLKPTWLNPKTGGPK